LGPPRRSREIVGTLLVVGVVVAIWGLTQWIGGFLLLIGLLGWGAWRLAAALFRPGTVADRILLALTLCGGWIVVMSELLSAGRLLGQPLGWLIGAALLAIAGLWLPRSLSRLPSRPARLDCLWSWVPAHPVGRLIVGVIALHLGAVFFLTFFTGINVSDSVVAYLPRSVRYLQNGTFAVYDTHYDYLPGFHQTLVAMQLLFLHSDILVVPMSFLTGLAVSVGIFAFARSLRWPAPLPLVAALLPWTMPAFLLHSSASNFDILTGLWLLLAFYFLRRGYAATDRRWLAAAALATALALATKPTFWFGAPALGICWLLTLLRPLWKHRVAQSAKMAGVAAVIVVAIGTPFLIRNVLIQRTLLGPPELSTFLIGEMSLPDRFQLLAFNSLALGYQLVTPPSLMSRESGLGLNDRFARMAQSYGFDLPDDRLTPMPGWSELIRHALPGHRYDNNHASFGAAFVLVVLPSMLVVFAMRRRLGPRWPFSLAPVAFALSYFLVYGFVYRYQVGSIRFLVEPIIVLAVIAPAWLALLPRAARGPVIVALAALLIWEMNDVIRNNRWVPPDRVMVTPRTDQLFVFAGAPPADAARMLDRKYPPSELPEVLIHDDGTGHPNFPDYVFLGPTLQRRTRYWVPLAGTLPPAPFLTLDPALAQRLIGAGMLPDRLDNDTWLLLPNDRLRVRMTVMQYGPAADPVLRLELSAPPSKYQAPQFDVLLLDGGQTITLQRFGPATAFELPLAQARRGALRVEVRDGERGRTTERVTISKAVLLGL
jgi:hypothetical protein